MMWAFEWHDTSKELRIKRGASWFYFYLEAMDPAQTIKLVEAEMTPQLRQFCSQIDGVTNYVNQTFSLMKTAAARRPKTLLVERSTPYQAGQDHD